MKIQCCDCKEIIDTKSNKIQLVKIGNSYKCIRCRGFRFLIIKIDKKIKNK